MVSDMRNIQLSHGLLARRGTALLPTLQVFATAPRIQSCQGDHCKLRLGVKIGYTLADTMIVLKMTW